MKNRVCVDSIHNFYEFQMYLKWKKDNLTTSATIQSLLNFNEIDTLTKILNPKIFYDSFNAALLHHLYYPEPLSQLMPFNMFYLQSLSVNPSRSAESDDENKSWQTSRHVQLSYERSLLISNYKRNLSKSSSSPA